MFNLLLRCHYKVGIVCEIWFEIHKAKLLNSAIVLLIFKNFLLFQNNFFLDHFEMLMSKINFKK
jgi:hypothetical protein